MAPTNDDSGGEIVSARQLVKRASEREDLLTSRKRSGGDEDGYEANFARMPLKPDHIQRPIVSDSSSVDSLWTRLSP